MLQDDVKVAILSSMYSADAEVVLHLRDARRTDRSRCPSSAGLSMPVSTSKKLKSNIKTIHPHPIPETPHGVAQSRPIVGDRRDAA
jgi:hypothetical protein